MTLSYCVKCRTKTASKGAVKSRSSTGRHMIKSQCTVCGTKKTQFVKSGHGVLGSLLGSLLPF